MNPSRSVPAILRRILILGLWLLPVLAAFYMMVKHWVPVPYWDEWDSPGEQLAAYYRGTLHFAELFRQHNESRTFFPRLFYLPISIVAGWDVRRFILLTFLLVLAGAIGLCRLVRQTAGSSRGVPFVCIAMNLLLFSPREYENFFYGLMGEGFTPAVALIFALSMNLSGRSLKAKTFVNAALAFVATYTYANGMLIWLLAFPLRAASPDETRGAPVRFRWEVIYLLLAVASIGGYFVTYRHPPVTPPFVSPFARLPDFLNFVLVWLGSLFTSSAPAICGAVILFLFIGLAVLAFGQFRRTGMWRVHYPWLVLGSYTLISGCVVAMGRLGFDYSMAGDSRYTASTVFLYIAVVGLGFTVYRQAGTRPLIRPILSSVAAILLVVLLAFWAITFKKERDLLGILTPARKHSLLVLRWSEAIPQNPEIVLLSPYPLAGVLSTIHTLAQHDGFRPRLVSQPLANIVNQRPDTSAATAGVLDGARFEAGQLLFEGWALGSGDARPADCVVVGFEMPDGAWQPFYVVETGVNRPDVAGKLGNTALARVGFSGRIEAASLPTGELTLKGWAVDLQHERAFPLSGAIKLPPRN